MPGGLEMMLEEFGSHDIFRPSFEAERSLAARAEEHLRSQFAPGVYTDPQLINAVLQHQFAFHANVLSELLPQLASRDFMSFVLHQYGEATQIEALHRQGALSAAENARWEELGPTFRRAAKFLAERTVQLRPPQGPAAPNHELSPLLEMAWICAEQLVDLSTASETVHALFPDQVRLEIFPPSSSNYFDFRIVGQVDVDQRLRVEQDQKHRSRFLPDAENVLGSIDLQGRFLDPVFRETVGLEYTKAIHLLRLVITGSEPPPDGFPIPFVHKDRTVEALVGATGVEAETVRRVLAGFTVSPEGMEHEGREIWKPKQEYRALRRAFFDFLHTSGPHLVFNREMAAESLAGLVRGAAFGQFPEEWRSEAVNRALSRLANEAGKWFERVVGENLERLGFRGLVGVRRIGTGESRIKIPPEVGEIDYIGYSARERLLVVIECKLVRDSTEPRFFRDDIAEFVTSKRAYVKKFQRKYGWVVDQLPLVCRTLSSHFAGEPIAPMRVAGALVTYFPTIAEVLIKDFPCVSLAELMLHSEMQGEWPYTRGVTAVGEIASARELDPAE